MPFWKQLTDSLKNITLNTKCNKTVMKRINAKS